MKVLPYVRAAVSALDEAIVTIRLYRGLVLVNDVKALPPAVRRRLGLGD